jgi:DNA-binding transcriptional regulator YiaG
MRMNKTADEKTSRAFPWKCHQCGRREKFLERFPYRCESAHDGRLYSIEIPDLEAPRCRHCGAIVLRDKDNERISQELRHQAGLLSPEEIRQRREELGLKPEQLADYLRVPAEIVLCWESGWQIQSGTQNNLLKVFFELPQVRHSLGFPSPPAGREKFMRFLDI